jgi:ParB family transcriptional regulator, chromosome partitioning protein
LSRKDEIAQRVLGKLANREAAEPSPVRPRPMSTFIGQVGQQMTQGFAARVEVLEKERANGRVVLELDPKRIRFGELANRDERGLNSKDEAFRELKTDLAENGQEFPIKVRAITGEPDHDYEVVAGHRRLRAALELDRERPEGFRILAILDANAAELKTLALKMYRENKIRSDLSPYEYGRTFQKWIDAGIFRTQAEIAAAAKLSQPTVSFYMGVFELPKEIHQAFGDPRSISMRWMQELSKQLKSNEAAVLDRARAIAKQNPRPSADAVFTALTVPVESASKRGSTPTRSESFKLNNKVIFTFGRKDRRFSVKLGKLVDKGLQKELAEELQEFLRGWLTKRMKGR